MSRHRMTIVIDVDDEVLADHVEKSNGERPPYETDVSEWDGSDIFSAASEGIIDPGEVTLDWYDGEVTDASD